MGCPDIEELRRWSAEDLCGLTTESFSTTKGVRAFYIDNREMEGPHVRWSCLRGDWAPDSPDSPAKQILTVIEKMLEKGYSLTTFETCPHSSVMNMAVAIFKLGVYPPAYLKGYSELTPETPHGSDPNRNLAILKAAYSALNQIVGA